MQVAIPHIILDEAVFEGKPPMSYDEYVLFHFSKNVKYLETPIQHRELEYDFYLELIAEYRLIFLN